MANFYEILSLNPYASIEEIQAAIEAHYNQVRRLTTHYDPAIVNQANQALLILEQARTTLLDPSKRAEYDASLGLGVAGIADPSLADVALPQKPGATGSPFSNFQAPSQAQRQLSFDIWTCAKCNQPNPKGTLYCQNCRHAIGRICPQCQTMYETKANFCPKCSLSYENALTHNQLTTELTQKKNLRLSLTYQAGTEKSQIFQFLQYLSVGGTGWAIFGGLISLDFFFASIARLIIPLFGNQVIRQSAWMTVINIFSGIDIAMRWIILLATIVLMVILWRRRNILNNKVAIAGFGLLLLLFVMFGGRNLSYQIYGGRGNTELIYPSLIASALIAGGWWFAKNYQVPATPIIINQMRIKRFEPIFNLLLQNYEIRPLVFAGIALALSLFTLFFSASRSLVSLFAGIAFLLASITLAVIAYRCQFLVRVEEENLLAAKEKAQNELAILDREITALEQQVTELGAQSH